jgi:hypothetical protein
MTVLLSNQSKFAKVSKNSTKIQSLVAVSCSIHSFAIIVLTVIPINFSGPYKSYSENQLVSLALIRVLRLTFRPVLHKTSCAVECFQVLDVSCNHIAIEQL